MEDVILDIREKFRLNSFKNKEHIKLGIVTRILKELGWNIWDPKEFNTRHVASSKEDSISVDLALSLNDESPCICLVVKDLGSLFSNIKRMEKQLSDFSENNISEFIIMTDGLIWRFYFSEEKNFFSEKCFAIINLLEGNIKDIQNKFIEILKKDNFDKNSAKNIAFRYCDLSLKQKLIEDIYPKAERMVLDDPFMNLLDAFKLLFKKYDNKPNDEEIIEYIKRKSKKPKPKSKNMFTMEIDTDAEEKNKNHHYTPEKPSSNLTKGKLIELQNKYKTDEEIGNHFGVTRQAIHQLRKKWGVPSLLIKNDERNINIKALYKKGHSGTEIAQILGLSVSQTYRIINQNFNKTSGIASDRILNEPPTNQPDDEINTIINDFYF